MTCDESKSCKIHATLVEIIAEKLLISIMFMFKVQKRYIVHDWFCISASEKLLLKWPVVVASKPYIQVSDK